MNPKSPHFFITSLIIPFKPRGYFTPFLLKGEIMVEAWILAIFCIITALPIGLAEAIREGRRYAHNRQYAKRYLRPRVSRV